MREAWWSRPWRERSLATALSRPTLPCAIVPPRAERGLIAKSCFSNRSLTLQGTIATSPLGKAISRRLPSIFNSTRTRSRAAIPAHKPRHPVNGPLRTRSRSPERRLKLGLGCFGRTTKPLRSRARRLAMSASGTLAGRSPSITSERMPGLQRAACHCSSMATKAYPGNSGWGGQHPLATNYTAFANPRKIGFKTAELEKIQRQRLAMRLQPSSGTVGHERNRASLRFSGRRG